MIGKQAFRKRLSYITNHLPAEIHAIEIQSLQRIWHHSVVWLINSRFEQVNCVKFAFLDLDWKDRLHDEDDRNRKMPVTTHLVKILIDTKVLTTSPLKYANYAIYYRKDRITHIGVMKKNHKVQSKWGKGLVYEHGVKEVPVNYGDPVFYRHAINKQYTYMKVSEALEAYFQ